MLKEKQIQEIREHLDNSRNPIFFFDNDPDGLCSFLLLRRFCGKGTGEVIKSSQGLSKGYFNKVIHNKADCIFVLDKPVIEKEFYDMAEEHNLPIVHIDHHPIMGLKVQNFYNPMEVSETNEPCSDICFRVTKRKEDMWIAVAGSISDSFIPDFIEDFKKRNPELLNCNYRTAFDILYKCELGKIISMMSYCLRDSESNVQKFINYVLNMGNYRDLIEETENNKSFFKNMRKIEEKYLKLMRKAEENVEKNYLFFSYSGDMGLNRDLANELMYKYPGKIIILAFSKGGKTNVSLRWVKNIRTMALKAIENIDGAKGGGHENSLAIQLASEDLSRFKENLLEEIKKN